MNCVTKQILKRIVRQRGNLTFYPQCVHVSLFPTNAWRYFPTGSSPGNLVRWSYSVVYSKGVKQLLLFMRVTQLIRKWPRLDWSKMDEERKGLNSQKKLFSLDDFPRVSSWFDIPLIKKSKGKKGSWGKVAARQMKGLKRKWNCEKKIRLEH